MKEWLPLGRVCELVGYLTRFVNRLNVGPYLKMDNNLNDVKCAVTNNNNKKKKTLERTFAMQQSNNRTDERRNQMTNTDEYSFT